MSDALKLKNQLCHRFYTVSNAFSRAYRPLLAELGITYPQYVVMMALWEEDYIHIANLIDKTKVDGGAMSLILKKLTAKGYVTVKQHDKDKRIRIVELTQKGQDAKNNAEQIPQAMLCKFDEISTQEAQTLIELIDKLSDNLNRDSCR